MNRFIQTVVICVVIASLSLIGGCSDDDPVNLPSTGSVAGKVTFQGTWPITGDVQVSIFSGLTTPFIPMGPPDGVTDPIQSGVTTFDYNISGLDFGTYTVIYVGWRDPLDPANARLLGMYWTMTDSVGIGALGGPVDTPTPVTISSGMLNHSNLDIKADLDLAP